jgi:phosphoribosylformylglycinamidine cyclo-ligase
MLDGKPYREALMTPTKLYVKPVLEALKAMPIKALAHITGGGLLENIPRVLPDYLAAELTTNAWPKSDIFQWLQATAGINDTEMARTFNWGIGMVVVIDSASAAACKTFLEAQGEKVFNIGRIAKRKSEAVTLH